MSPCTWCGSTRRTIPAYWSPDVHLCPSCAVVGANTFDRSAWPVTGVPATVVRDRMLAERHPRRTDEILHELGRTIARRTRAAVAQRRGAA